MEWNIYCAIRCIMILNSILYWISSIFMKVYVNISYQARILLNISRKVSVPLIFIKKLFNKGHKTRSEYFQTHAGITVRFYAIRTCPVLLISWIDEKRESNFVLFIHTRVTGWVYVLIIKEQDICIVQWNVTFIIRY